MSTIATDKKEFLHKALDYLIIMLIGSACYCYSVFGAVFAEWHVKFPFLIFPIFIGEILLGLTLLLLVTKIYFFHIQVKRWQIILVSGYVGFVLIKALHGYVKYNEWGALALRHAAEFYYPLFAIIVYYAYRRSFFSTPVIYAIIFGIVLAYFRGIYVYSLLPLLLLGVVCILKIRNPVIQILLLVLLFSVVPYTNFFDNGRTRILGNSVGFVTLFILLLNRFLHGRKFLKFGLTGGFVALLLVVVLAMADKNAVISLVSFKEIAEKWKICTANIEAKSATFVFEKNNVRLYNQNWIPPETETQIVQADNLRSPENEITAEIIYDLTSPDYAALYSSDNLSDDSAEAALGSPSSMTTAEIKARRSRSVSSYGILRGPLPAPSKDVQVATGIDLIPRAPMLRPPERREMRSLETAYNNILFRVFIWRDIVKEIRDKKPILGADFGLPFRSKSIEILGWADDAWRRDGWISTHNSYLTILYRAGAVGLLLIFLTLWGVFNSIRFVVRSRSLIGVFIVSLLFYWLTVANFTEFFELPYTAVIFWSFLGLTLAYCQDQENRLNRNGNPGFDAVKE